MCISVPVRLPMRIPRPIIDTRSFRDLSSIEEKPKKTLLLDGRPTIQRKSSEQFSTELQPAKWRLRASPEEYSKRRTLISPAESVEARKIKYPVYSHSNSDSSTTKSRGRLSSGSSDSSNAETDASFNRPMRIPTQNRRSASSPTSAEAANRRRLLLSDQSSSGDVPEMTCVLGMRHCSLNSGSNSAEKGTRTGPGDASLCSKG